MASHLIFDRTRIRKHRDRAADVFLLHDFFLREVAARLGDRLLDVKRQFPVALNLGAYNGLMEEYIPDKSGVQKLIHIDSSERMLEKVDGLKIQADEEYLPLADESVDLVLSIGSLHLVNDLPGCLIQIYRALKPGGLMLATLPGGESLKELRASLEYAELSLTGGISPHISPFVDVKDAGALLQRAGFILPVADSDQLMIAYSSPKKLFADLRGNGQTNAMLAADKHFMRRELYERAMSYYQDRYRDGERYMASAELITLTGWKPDASPSTVKGS